MPLDTIECNSQLVYPIRDVVRMMMILINLYEERALNFVLIICINRKFHYFHSNQLKTLKSLSGDHLAFFLIFLLFRLSLRILFFRHFSLIFQFQEIYVKDIFIYLLLGCFFFYFINIKISSTAVYNL